MALPEKLDHILYWFPYARTWGVCAISDGNKADKIPLGRYVQELFNLFFGLFALLSFVVLALTRVPKTVSETKPFERGPSL